MNDKSKTNRPETFDEFARWLSSDEANRYFNMLDRKRRRLKLIYKEFYDEVAAILFRHDPIGINFETNTDEYEPEVDRILPKLRRVHSKEELLRIIHGTFVVMFYADIAGSVERYESIAQEVWETWGQYKRKQQLAAEVLLPDYLAGSELTDFVDLDSEDFRR